MKKLSQGVHKFQQEVFGAHKELFARLATSQKPHTLFVTCSDSRINPNMITQTDPGEIFILRNAGNIIPSYSTLASGEAATIEFALLGLGIEHIVVCGHSNCGAMKAVLEPELTQNLPALRSWLAHAQGTRQLMKDKYANRIEDEHLNIAVQENILEQLEHLRTYPAVAARLAEGKLRLYGWVYKIQTGEVFAYDPKDEQFHPLAEVNSVMPKPQIAGDDEKLQI